MTLTELLQAVDKLTLDELQQLREHIEQRQRAKLSNPLASLDHALEALREGLTDEQLDRIEWAMNVELLEPPDDIT